ncbi:MAG: hypothetical protein AABX13_01430 [Nanoarchaeota archaeon]
MIEELLPGNKTKMRIVKPNLCLAIQEIFITLDLERSVKVETVAGFLKQKNKPLYQNILREHIVVSGGQQFMNILQKAKK